MLQKHYSRDYSLLYPTRADQRGAFAHELHSIRVYYRIPAIELAEAANTYSGRMSEYETGKRLPTEQMLNRICHALRLFGASGQDITHLRETHDISVNVSSNQTIGKMRKKYSCNA